MSEECLPETNNAPPRRLLVAGGTKTIVYGGLTHNLRKYGAVVDWHVEGLDGDGDTFQGIIPAHCDGIIVLQDLISHSAAGKVLTTAKKSGIPYALTPSKWSTALQFLQEQGVLPMKNKKDAVASLPVIEVVQEWAVNLVVDARKEGREVTVKELQAILRERYTAPTAKGVDLAEVFSRANNIMPPAVPPAPEPTVNDMRDFAVKYVVGQYQMNKAVTSPEIGNLIRATYGEDTIVESAFLDDIFHWARQQSPLKPVKPEVANSTDDYALWVGLIIEDNPDYLLDQSKILRELMKLTKASPGPGVLNKIVIGIHDRLRARKGDDFAWRLKLQDKWLQQMWEHVKSGRMDYPGNAEIRSFGMKIFGVSVQPAQITKTRAAVWGAWAEKLETATAVARYFESRYPIESRGRSLQELLEDGKVKGFHMGSRWYTSEMAVDDVFGAKAAPIPETTEAPILAPRIPVTSDTGFVDPRALADLNQKIADLAQKMAVMEQNQNSLMKELGHAFTENFQLKSRVEALEALAKEVKTPDTQRTPSFGEAFQVLFGNATSTEVKMSFDRISPPSDK